MSYTLVAQGRSVTSNWVDADLGVINGGAAFVTLVEHARRPHDVRMMPATWKQSASGLERAPGGHPNHYRAADFDTLADSPIVAGTMTINYQFGGWRQRQDRQLLHQGQRCVVPSRRAHPARDRRAQVHGRRDARRLRAIRRRARIHRQRAARCDEHVAGRSVEAWWAKAIESPGELDYGEMLAWYGLRFAAGAGESWKLEVRPEATAAQNTHLQALLTSSGPVRPARPRR